MPSTRKFELHFVTPSKQYANAAAAVVAMELGAKDVQLVSVRMRAFDEASYQHCLLAVRRNFFGLINRKWFLFVDIQTGVRYALESEEVAFSFGCKPELQITIKPRKAVKGGKVSGIEVRELPQWELVPFKWHDDETARDATTQALADDRKTEE